MKKVELKEIDPPMTTEEFAHLFHQPGRSDPAVRITKFNVTLDFGTFTTKCTWSPKEGLVRVEQAKRGKCLVKDRNG